MTPTPASPRARTTRRQGQAAMVEATIGLLDTDPPDRITVRAVAEASGHHHRFVQAWFGGKVGLFRAVFDELSRRTADGIRDELMPQGDLERTVQITALLMNWLVAADPGSLDGPRDTPILDQLIHVYRLTYGFDDATARLMALRVVTMTTAGALFRGPMGIEADDVVALAELERELATLLAAARAADR